MRQLLRVLQVLPQEAAVLLGLFQGHPLKGKLTVIGLFLVTAVVATTGYVGRNEFNAAVFEAGDQIREPGDTFNTLEGSTTELTLHASSIASDTTSSACSDSGTTSALEGASTGLSGAQMSCQHFSRALVTCFMIPRI